MTLFILGLLLTGWMIQPAVAQDTLYMKLGGQAGVAHIIDITTTLFVTDDRVKADFEDLDQGQLRQGLEDKVCEVTGGPCVSHGRTMKAIHARLGITQAKFNAVAEDFQTALRQAGIPYQTQNKLMAILAPMQSDVITK